MKVTRKIGWTIVVLIIVLMGTMFGFGNRLSSSTRHRTKQHATKALEYCRNHGLRTDYCFLVDFNVHSCKNRFFVWDFKKNKIVYATICEHGRGGGSSRRTPRFSNQIGSKCSSLGHYTVTKKRKMYNHAFIPCYELVGKDASNNNAVKRGILIHPNVSQIPTYPLPLLWRTEGCFGLSLKGFKKVEFYKNLSPTPMLLWAYK